MAGKMIVHTILYVSDQNKSCEFYRKVLSIEPRLHVPGMTEFELSENHILGLMPEKGIKKLLGNKLEGYGPCFAGPALILQLHFGSAGEPRVKV